MWPLREKKIQAFPITEKKLAESHLCRDQKYVYFRVGLLSLKIARATDDEYLAKPSFFTCGSRVEVWPRCGTGPQGILAPIPIVPVTTSTFPWRTGPGGRPDLRGARSFG